MKPWTMRDAYPPLSPRGFGAEQGAVEETVMASICINSAVPAPMQSVISRNVSGFVSVNVP